ncbi:glycosyltransferase involved in cell wall biosynthesis [Micromonospora sp. M71_S20]|uniref:glycosyltransferase family 4 protein n=1 Tax=Micromonospora sp. M71_S20 TaxID=592872 RepID=UPI000EAD84AA|nr:glycosyltransferase [Micromonospora sp. M71_S20]RLK22500.1 glycosyltransferase involved in cell wall biosynthesis [Micromonospora sp. M71_S20]
MSSSARPPRLVVLVANGITGDSRVQKTALAAARDGWDVVLVGRSLQAKSKHLDRSAMGPIEVIRIPVKPVLSRQRGSRHKVRQALTQFRLPDKPALARYRARHQAWLRAQTSKPNPPPRAWIKAHEAFHELRVRAWGWEQFHGTQPGPPTGDWRTDWPILLDIDLAFGPVLEELQPDVIHANDINTIPTAAMSAARLRAQGKECVWIYDAHEYVQGVEWPKPEQASGVKAAEREFIVRADAVVTVSEQIAEKLRTSYGLAKSPLVVGNSPVREGIRSGNVTVSVRARAGLAEDVPLMVYAGWIGPERGLDTVIAGLPQLPEHHLALVTGRTTPLLEGLLAKAGELGVRDRVHLLPYVAPYEVADYLSSADLGLIPFQRTPNCELSLPTKVSEYLHAGLPLVTSDVQVVSAYVNQHQIGEVFTSGDADTFVAAVKRATARRQELAAHISEPILDDLSWERQSSKLLQLYRDVSALAPAVPRPDVPWTVQEGPPVRTSERRELTAWRALGETRIRLGLGPANYAGQAAAFAKAICRDNPDVSAEVVMNMLPASREYPADIYVDAQRYRDLDFQLEQVRRVLTAGYTHLLVDAFIPIFGHLNGDTIQGDLAALNRAGIKVGLLAHGSEIRHPGRHRERHEFSLFDDAPDGIAQKLQQKAERNRRVAEETGLPAFVTTPDLLEDLPWATWVPLVVDVEYWACDRPVMERSRPLVLHAPSKRWTKGTDRILPAMQALHDKGAIELRVAEGVAWADMPELVKECDIVLDQFTTGSFGTFAVEAMAAGKPVVAYLSDQVVSSVGSNLPIVNASPVNLTEVVESLLDDRDTTAKIGLASAQYAQACHDGTWTARQLAPFLNS